MLRIGRLIAVVMLLGWTAPAWAQVAPAKPGGPSAPAKPSGPAAGKPKPPPAPALPTGLAPAAAPKGPAAPPSAPSGDPKVRAKELFERGVKAYEGARYPEALASFQEAFRLRPHPLVRVNIANCYDKLGKPLEALFHFEQFLASDAATPAQRQEVVSATERLRKQMGSLLLRVTPDGALVTIDGGEQRRTPILDAVQLPAGKHVLEVKLDGYQPAQRSFTLHGGASVELEIVLEPTSNAVAALPAPAPSPAAAPVASAPAPKEAKPVPVPAPATAAAPPAKPAPAEPTSGDGLPTGTWVLGGIGAALLAGATITGILALGAESDYDRSRMLAADTATTPIARQASYDDARAAADRADALALTTDVLLVGAVVAVGAAVVVAVTAGGGEETPPVALAPTPGGGARLALRF